LAKHAEAHDGDWQCRHWRLTNRQTCELLFWCKLNFFIIVQFSSASFAFSPFVGALSFIHLLLLYILQATVQPPQPIHFTRLTNTPLGILLLLIFWVNIIRKIWLAKLFIGQFLKDKWGKWNGRGKWNGGQMGHEGQVKKRN
jgi:hypothetical protein